MKRLFVVAAFMLAVVTANPVAAQEDDYPPGTVVGGIVLLGGQFDPGGTGTIAFGGTSPGTAHGGTVFSEPITLPVTTSGTDGELSFAGFPVPSDFELDAVHRSDVRQTDGTLLASIEFCVNGAGTITSDPVATCGIDGASASTGSLARTGTDLIAQGLRWGFGAIGLGALALFWRRRSLQAHARGGTATAG